MLGEIDVVGVGAVACLVQADMATTIPLFSKLRRRAGRRADVSSMMLAAEAN